jgi:hypothetical protein
MKLINLFCFLFIFIFALSKPNNKFVTYIAAKIEKKTTDHFKEKQYIAKTKKN